MILRPSGSARWVGYASDPSKVARTLPVALVYFTTWNALLVLFGRWTHRHVDLLLTSSFTAVAATCVVLACPGHIRIWTAPDAPYDVPGWNAMHVVAHVLPLLAVLLLFPGRHWAYDRRFAAALLLLLVYWGAMDTGAVYGAGPVAQVAVLAAGIAVRALLGRVA